MCIRDSYQTISKQDTLQSIAKLNEQDRAKKLELMFEPKKQITTINSNGKLINNEKNTKITKQNNSTFYFSNFNAISTGFSDFKKKWGNRLLEDNWRQSVKSSGQINQQNQINALGNTTETVSYTHLDVYKRQPVYLAKLLASFIWLFSSGSVIK